MNWLLLPWIVDATRFALALVLLAAGTTKLASLRAFQASLGSVVPFLSERARYGLGFALATTEIALVGVLAIWPVAGAMLAGCLFFAFALLAERLRKRNIVVSCQCFGPFSSGSLGRRTAVRNGALSLLTLVVVLRPPQWTGRSFPAFLIAALVLTAIALPVLLRGAAMRSRLQVHQLHSEAEARGR